MNRRLNDTDQIKHPFKVNDDYFDELTQNIQNKVGQSKKVSIVFKWQWVLAPAMMVIIALSIWFNLNDTTGPTSQELIAQVSTNEIIAYLEFSDLTEQDLLILSNDETFKNLSNIEDIDLEEADLEDLINDFDLNDIEI